MDLIFFDLDGTLLNKSSQISSFTKETLALLGEKDIAFTVATGRTMHSAQFVLEGQSFLLPHIYNNGVAIWDPSGNALTLENLLAPSEVNLIIEHAVKNNITPFINTVNMDSPNHEHVIYHSTPKYQVERDLIEKYFSRTKAKLDTIESLPATAHITNISMIGDAALVYDMYQQLNMHDELIAYSGPAIEGDEYRWMDVHHKLASKGSAVELLRNQLGASNVICFGDSDNDLSMFELADEAYAPSNAKPYIKDAATSVIGHHDEDGIARFLRERFSL
ncbi:MULTISPECIES: HAD family hydrolase [Alteromonas]|jgi:5-amino-6-(5-phospho-D-ribitylamino)uracil phosphatase|uniref:Haloacid dehalogenase n=1 Tax=Alteromonas mediterranea (strain DSM 17117 / CIP 110805 / LMG 28347 / Deep ecotype) TaxID=1774373 RepID=T2DLD8_ALTMD|nr:MULTISPECIES: Cof-type HAD-IIB family hydrolase [Alteromonas]AGV53775.1 haloacid dehalogenase [Alteromonas mediterranea DE]NQY16898.1 Cof-type HAD-IIB family hydrolase [Alteromonas sp.]CAH1204229.1 5-amino-6-(5-phospho-D-ribitylamino)uracil phosphatase YwtE [Alteromonas mediterranea]